LLIGAEEPCLYKANLLPQPEPLVYILGLVKVGERLLELMPIYAEATNVQEKVGDGILIRRSFFPVYGQLPKSFFQVPREAQWRTLLPAAGVSRLSRPRSVSEPRHARPEGPKIRRILHDIRHGFLIEPKEHTEALIVKVFTTIVQKLGNRGNLGTIPACLRSNQLREAMNEIESALLAGQRIKVVKRIHDVDTIGGRVCTRVTFGQDHTFYAHPVG
jgi:hypothetical protein